MGITFRTDDLAKWGTGKGSNLLPEEVDENFWELTERVTDLETSPLQPDDISNITVSGSQMTIHLQSGATFGPFTLPTAVLRWRDSYVAGDSYVRNDLIKVPGRGVYLVRENHTAPTTFDPGLLTGGNITYVKVFSLPGSPTMNWQGDWQSATDYVQTDIVYIEGDGSYFVNVDHTSDADFDPDRVILGEQVYIRLIQQTTANGSDLWNPVDFCTTANITLSGEQTIDGVVTSGSRGLVRNQTDGTKNGIYITASGAWTRAPDADATLEFSASKQVLVLAGTANAGRVFFLRTVPPIVVGTDPIFFASLTAPDNPRLFLTIADASTTLIRRKHNQRYLRFTSASAQSLLMDGTDAFPKARGFWVIATAAGVVTVTPSGGVALEAPSGVLTGGNLVLIPHVTYFLYKVDDLAWTVQQGVPAASSVRNDSSVTGATVKNALEQLASDIAAAGGGHAPVGADYLVKTANGTLTAERVVTDTATIVWDWTTSGQAKATFAGAASNVTNNSSVSGASVKDALETLASAIGGGGYGDEQAQDAIAAAFAAGTQTGISITYTDASNSFSFSLNITGLTEDTQPDGNADFVVTFDNSATAYKKVKPKNLPVLESFIIPCSDETTAIAAGTNKVIFRMPYAFKVTEVRASLSTAQTSGSIFTVDINESGTTIISTKLTIDNTEKTSKTAVTAPVISDADLADDAEVSIDVDQIGDGTAKGLKVTIIGYKVL